MARFHTIEQLLAYGDDWERRKHGMIMVRVVKRDYGSSYAFGCDGVEDRHSVRFCNSQCPHDPTRIKVCVCPSIAGDSPRKCM
jgi:hypothetical protein